MSKVEEVLSRLDPKTRKRVMAASEAKMLKMKTPSMSLNKGLQGGVGVGRQTLIWGNK